MKTNGERIIEILGDEYCPAYTRTGRLKVDPDEINDEDNMFKIIWIHKKWWDEEYKPNGGIE